MDWTDYSCVMKVVMPHLLGVEVKGFEMMATFFGFGGHDL